MRNLKIVLFLPSLDIGGVEKVFITLANHFADLNHEVELVVSKNTGALSGELSSKVKVIDLECKRLAYSLFKLINYLSNANADILLSGPTYPNFISIIAKLLSRRSKLKLIITHHNFQDIEMQGLGLRGKLMPRLIKLLYGKADAVVAVSDALKDSLIKNLGVNKDIVHRIYNPVLNEVFYQRAEAYNIKDLLPSNFDRYCIAVGRTEPVKDFKSIIKAFHYLKLNKLLSSQRLVIVGDGSEFEELSKLVTMSGLEDVVHFTGGLSNPLPLIKGAELLIQSSFSESFSIVIVEAVAVGIKVITTGTFGAREIFKNQEEDFFVRMNSPESIAEMITNMKNKPVNKQNVDLSLYDINFIGSQYLNLFYECCE